jgi:AsmA protein
LKRGLAVLGVAALFAGAIVVALPYAASNRIVRDRIALEMGAWSGFDVAIGASPEIEIWPTFRAILTEVAMSPRNAPGGRAAIEAERVEIELSPLAALSGDVVFSTARLIKPTFRVEASAAGSYAAALPGGGRIARSIGTARAIVAENRSSPDIGKLPADAFGIVSFTDGRIVAGSPSGDETIVSALSGTVEWPTLNGPGLAKATGTWRGEEVSLDISSANPLLLFGGGAAPVSVTMRSAPASFRFDGTAGLLDNAYVNGKGKFLAPSLRRMLEWSHAETAANLPAGSVGIEADVAGDSRRMRFEAATVFLDDNPGQGALDLILTGKLPVVSGTLAFETLDLESFLSAFTPLEPEGRAGPGVIDGSFADRINLDLRLSAAKATANAIELTDVAATAQVNESFAAFDISDAMAFGGNVQAGMRFTRRPVGAAGGARASGETSSIPEETGLPEGTGDLEGAPVPQGPGVAEATDVEMRLLASDIDGGAFGAATGMTGLVPVGRGNISVILKGPGNAWDSILEHAYGSITASFGPGAFSAFDLDGFLERTRQGGFFALADVSRGALPIDALDLKASVADGVATVERAEARSSRGRIELSGIVRYAGRGLALSGSIVPAGQQAAPTTAQRFFVGGSWSAPFISPVPAAPPQ